MYTRHLYIRRIEFYMGLVHPTHTTTTIIITITIIIRIKNAHEIPTGDGGTYKLRKLMAVCGRLPRRYRLFLTGPRL